MSMKRVHEATRTGTWHRRRAPSPGSSDPNPCGNRETLPKVLKYSRGSSSSNTSTCKAHRQSLRSAFCSHAHSPFGNLLQVRLAREPHVQRVEPLRYETRLDQLAHHRRTQERGPRENVLQRREILLTRVDDEPFPKSRAELREDMLEDKSVPIGGWESLRRGSEGLAFALMELKSERNSHLATAPSPSVHHLRPSRP